MSTKQKKMADWTDYIGGSQMPNDELTFTDASTYGLQGFQFDTNLGGGVSESPARLPEIRGLSGLPDGLVQASEEDLDLRDLTERHDGPDLNFMLSEAEGALPTTAAQKKEAAIVVLDWLDPTQEQDLGRLPVNPVNIKPDLDKQWTHHRPSSFNLIPNRDKDIAEYESSIQEGPRSGLPGQKVSSEVLKGAILKAIRQSHYGASMLDIKRDLVATLGHEATRTREAVRLIEEDHGLSGKVFVRASAFPGIKNGKWVDHLKKVAHTARYVITDDETIATHLGMTMVSEVPWGEALAHYRPLLTAAGYKVASQGTPKEILRRAFITGAVASVVEPTLKPQAYVPQRPEVPGPNAYFASTEEQAGNRKMRAAHLWIAKKVVEGKISSQDAQHLYEVSQRPGAQDVQILKMASDLVVASAPPVKEYKGAVQKEALAKKEIVAKAAIPMSDVGIQRTLLRWARLRMTEGAAGDKLDSLLEAKFSSALLKVAAEPLAKLRKAHEGLSGHLYVDADAYASSTGVTGCEKGALKHRADGLEFVLAMKRCASCASNPDGVCQKYNKRLAQTVPVADPQAYQKKAIRLACKSKTKTFVAAFNPSEFALHNGALDGVAVNETPSTGMPLDVTFGGLQLE